MGDVGLTDGLKLSLNACVFLSVSYSSESSSFWGIGTASPPLGDDFFCHYDGSCSRDALSS